MVRSSFSINLDVYNFAKLANNLRFFQFSKTVKKISSEIKVWTHLEKKWTNIKNRTHRSESTKYTGRSLSNWIEIKTIKEHLLYVFVINTEMAHKMHTYAQVMVISFLLLSEAVESERLFRFETVKLFNVIMKCGILREKKMMIHLLFVASLRMQAYS